MFLAKYARFFSVKRSIPYVVKGNWKLPDPAKVASITPSPVEDPKTDILSTAAEKNVNVPKNWRKIKTLPQWKKQMFALKEKFPMGWNSPKKLSRPQMHRLREIKKEQPDISLDTLASMFKISPEAVRRIIKSSWKPDSEKLKELDIRWKKRKGRLENAGILPSKKSPTSNKTDIYTPNIVKVEEKIF